ncbi:MAG: hypothetical protein FJW31_08910 [Acidobacteria bacterium]|nr:hypothetical protein [Acidobacteriota bacterium]
MDNDKFELELRRVMQRVEPPAGFAEKVIAHTRAPPPQQRRPRPMPWLAAALAATMLMTFGAAWVKGAEDIRRGGEVKRQLFLALEITGEKLAPVNQVLNGSTH